MNRMLCTNRLNVANSQGTRRSAAVESTLRAKFTQSQRLDIPCFIRCFCELGISKEESKNRSYFFQPPHLFAMKKEEGKAFVSNSRSSFQLEDASIPSL
ncbi:hypothetical protein AVEN_247999-1 [Araneus ventricosus]|uniref:Uncharacterized protein n=1 Tax=Araneus ventricosus TaxID=182803 RepID=A0A4Y2M0F1_ARAVE|nr:hypothetical protein AVEN_247999-1 [Araneus ventricosus]